MPLHHFGPDGPSKLAAWLLDHPPLLPRLMAGQHILK